MTGRQATPTPYCHRCHGDGDLPKCPTCGRAAGRKATRQPWEPRPDGTHPEREIWAEAMGREATADTCTNCGGTGWDSTQHAGFDAAEPHPCAYCRGGTYSGQPAGRETTRRVCICNRVAEGAVAHTAECDTGRKAT